MNKFLYAFAILVVTNLSGQNRPKDVELYDPYTPEYFAGKDPAWLQEIQRNPHGVNFYEMERKFYAWLEADPDAKKKTVDKKPAVNFYRRWRKAYLPFVNSKGEIVLPTKKEYLAKIDRQNQVNAPKAPSRRSRRSTPSAVASANVWKNIGPDRTARNDGNTPYLPSYDSHANVFRIDVSKSNHNVLYSGAETGVVFKSTDKGKNWKACDPVFNFGKEISAIKINPKNENEVWVGSDVGLFVTRNGGQSFQRIQGINTRINSIRVNDNIITVAGKDGFYVYEGARVKKTFNAEAFDHELKPNDNKTIYLLAKNVEDYTYDLYISHDNGNSFKEVHRILPSIKSGRLAVTDAPGGEDYLYALVNVFDYNAYHGAPHIVQSKDGGKTWVDKTIRTDNLNEKENTFCPSIDAKNGGQGYYDMMIGVSGTNPEHVIFGLCSAYRSTEGGAGGYFSNSIGGYCNGNMQMHPDMQDIAVLGNEVWIANDGGIKYSPDFFEDKNKVENRINGVYAADFWGFGQGWNEDVMAGGRWHNGDAVMINNESYGYGKVSVYVGGVEQATGYVMLSNPKKVYFTDSGMFTMPDNIGGKPIADYARFYTRPYEALQSNGFLGFDPRYAKRMLFHSGRVTFGASATHKIIETTDEGKEGSYKEILNTDFTEDGSEAQQENFSNIVFARSNPNTIYAAGNRHIYKSTDNGNKWKMLQQIPENLGFKDEYLSTPTTYIEVDPRNENKIWAVQSRSQGAVFYSEDGGQSWKNPLDPTMKEKEFRWVILAGDEHNGVYLGTDNGSKVYYKDDTMANWMDYSSGFPPAARLTRLVTFFKEGKLRAATSQGIWEAPLYNQKFKPIAQPIALNLSSADLPKAAQEVQFDSYSIVNQNGATWEWSFSPEPYRVSNKKARNPKVVFKYNGEYDVTLKVKTPYGEDSRTIKKMIVVKNGEKRPSDTTPPKEPEKPKDPEPPVVPDPPSDPEPPQPPVIEGLSGLKFVIVNADNFTLTWDMPDKINAIAYYEVLLDGKVKDKTSQNKISITNLKPLTTYKVKIIAKKANGEIVAQSEEITVQTLEGKPISTSGEELKFYPNPVVNKILYAKGEKLAQIKWIKIYDMQGNLVREINNPFVRGNSINLTGLMVGTYVLTTPNYFEKIIVQ
ncbi:T9SS C-terminal target domain-containing protein [Ornithobacterium rhinotracheale]|uniref:fibronectin type III domain-containing protein n=1 Tax=Ornithobacterium rhinotracheale TaxID=28251 RepID=UPI00129CC4DB|nr:T9SS type A sorting domain-containing protein [Ornithobacterium rhinotracheale]MRI63287.1 T9SS C-terminal target domain-containing protein [Ornithobacterium rhinotracheale]